MVSIIFACMLATVLDLKKLLRKIKNNVLYFLFSYVEGKRANSTNHRPGWYPW